jgi:FtsZ-interacting cell division protein ZipA
VVSVGTANPGLTILLVILFLALVITVVVMAFLLSRARAEMFAARREARRAGGRHKAAVQRAGEAEEQAARLMHAVEAAVATARQAVDNKDQLELVNQQLAQLFAYVSGPLEELPPPQSAFTGEPNRITLPSGSTSTPSC